MILFGAAVGIQTSISCQVGRYIGVQDVERARDFFRVGKWVARLQIALTALAFYMANQWTIQKFTDSEDVKRVWDSIIIFVAFNFIPDHWQTFSQGVVRGLGVQQQLVMTILSIYWLINLPLCYILAFPVGAGIKGLWISQSLSLSLIGFCINRKVNTVDWHLCSLEAISRSEKAAQKR